MVAVGMLVGGTWLTALFAPPIAQGQRWPEGRAIDAWLLLLLGISSLIGGVLALKPGPRNTR
jgi:hypothetical protein